MKNRYFLTGNVTIEQQTPGGMSPQMSSLTNSRISLYQSSYPNASTTGGVYGFLAPSPELPRTPDVWQTFEITLIGRRVTVDQNSTSIIDNQEIPVITGGAVNSHEASPRPIYLQGSEKGHVAFRNIVITPAK